MKVSPRSSPAPKGHMYMKLMGNELQYFSLDGAFMDTLIREGTVLSKILLGFNRLWYVCFVTCTLKSDVPQFNVGKMLLSVSEADLKKGLDVDIHRSTMPFDAETIIPTECGLPMHLKLRGTAAIKVTGKIGVTGLPSLLAINRPGKLAKELSLDMELRPRCLSNNFGILRSYICLHSCISQQTTAICMNVTHICSF